MNVLDGRSYKNISCFEIVELRGKNEANN